MASDLVAVPTGSAGAQGKANHDRNRVSCRRPRCIATLYASEELMALSGQALIGAELAERLGVLDIDGLQPTSHRRTLRAPPELHQSLRRLKLRMESCLLLVPVYVHAGSRSVSRCERFSSSTAYVPSRDGYSFGPDASG